MVSQTAIYALQAVLYLAETDPSDLVRVGEMASALGVPRNYLSKILHVLARAGLLISTRGPKGGFRLRENPATLTLLQVVEPFNDSTGKAGCLLGRKRCTDASPCAAHDRWKRASGGVRDFFQTTTVLDLGRRPSGGGSGGRTRAIR